MNQDLSKVDAGIDRIYFCPHGWDENCECRKPKPGMLNQAIEDFNLTRKFLIFIGDEQTDIQAAKAANIIGIEFDAQNKTLNEHKINYYIDKTNFFFEF